MIYPIRFTIDAENDLWNLGGSIQKQVKNKLFKLERNPFLGTKLGKKQRHNLSGLYKLYVYPKTYRIIYRLKTPTQIEIIEIVGIGKRYKSEIYETIIKRLIDMEKD